MNDMESNQENALNARKGDSEPASEKRKLDIRMCPLAILSCIVAMLALLGCVIAAFPENPPLILPIVAFALALLAFIASIASLRRIGRGGGRFTGRGFAVIGIAVPLVLFLFAVFMPGLKRVRSVSYRLQCGSNLSRIGKAMLVYRDDYDDTFPGAGGNRDSTWGPTSDFQAATAAEAYGLEDGGGRASISANFYLLVKYADATPKSFLCPGDRSSTEFDPDKYEARNKRLEELWDFGPDPSKHCSFAYHHPFSDYGLSPYGVTGGYSFMSSSHPGMAVATDRNPWLPSRGAKPRNFELFDPDGDKEAVKAGNTHVHKGDGQNVLFVGGRVTFEKTSACGVNGDNIYTPQNGEDIEKGIVPSMSSRPASRTDSLLVHDPPRGGEQ